LYGRIIINNNDIIRDSLVLRIQRSEVRILSGTPFIFPDPFPKEAHESKAARPSLLAGLSMIPAKPCSVSVAPEDPNWNHIKIELGYTYNGTPGRKRGFLEKGEDLERRGK
jgi:hypothetical protein